MGYEVYRKETDNISRYSITRIIHCLSFFRLYRDPVTAILGTEYTEERAETSEEMGINEPVLVRYGNWLKDFVRGDFGTSYKYKMPVTKLISDKLPVTAYLAIMSLVIIIVVSVPVSVLMARFGKRKISKGFDILNQSVMAIPAFF